MLEVATFKIVKKNLNLHCKEHFYEINLRVAIWHRMSTIMHVPLIKIWCYSWKCVKLKISGLPPLNRTKRAWRTGQVGEEAGLSSWKLAHLVTGDDCARHSRPSCSAAHVRHWTFCLQKAALWPYSWQRKHWLVRCRAYKSSMVILKCARLFKWYNWSLWSLGQVKTQIGKDRFSSQPSVVLSVP